MNEDLKHTPETRSKSRPGDETKKDKNKLLTPGQRAGNIIEAIQERGFDRLSYESKIARIDSEHAAYPGDFFVDTKSRYLVLDGNDHQSPDSISNEYRIIAYGNADTAIPKDIVITSMLLFN